MSDLRDFVENMNPDLKAALQRGLMGMAAGGATMGGYKALTHRPKDPEESRVRPVVNSALLGAILGGAAGAGIPAGLKFMSPGATIPGLDKEDKSLFTKGIDAATGKAFANPFTTIGGGLGLAQISKTQGGPEHILKLLGNTLKSEEALPGKSKAALLIPLLYGGIGQMVDRVIKGQV